MTAVGREALKWLRALGAARPAVLGAMVGYAAIVALFLVSLPQFYTSSTGFTRLIRFGSVFYDRSLSAVRAVPHAIQDHSGGYDGQFYAQLAVEPFLRDRAIDVALDTPAYRARRILFSWTAYLMGLGQPARILRAYALQNILAWLVLAALLLRWLPPTTPRNVLPWCGCLFSAGLIASVTQALLEGPSLVLLTLAVWAGERGRSTLASGILGAAGLGRESNLLGAVTLVHRLPRTVRDAAVLAARLAMVAVPALLWSFYVRSVYAGFSYSNPDSFSLPFVGYVTKWTGTFTEAAAEGWNEFTRTNVIALTGLTVQVAYLCWRREWRDPWWRLGFVYVCFMPFLSPLVWEGYPSAAFRVLLPVTVAFNILVTRSRGFWPLAILGNLSIIVGIYNLKVPILAKLYERW